MKRKTKCAAIAAAAGLAALAAGGTVWSYRFIFHSPRGTQNDDHSMPLRQSEEETRRAVELIDRLNARPYEAVSIRSFDGLRLNGRLYCTDPGAPVAVLCHGYRGTPSRDFCGGADLVLSMGWNALLIEQRAHCSSEGHTISFGVNERYDCRDWCRFAAERFGAETPILLAGISMGAATVLMASALDLPESVRGILADCPYTAPAEIIAKVGRDMGIPAPATLAGAALAARTLGGFSLCAPGADAAEAVKRARVPILLIHGEEDGFVPCEMSRRIAAANPEKVRLETFPGARHGTSYLADTARYAALVRELCAQAAEGKKN